MGQKRVVPAGNHPPHCITLVRAQRVDARHSGENQVAPIKLLCNHRAEQQVELARKHFCPLTVLPEPRYESLFQQVLLLAGNHRFTRIDHSLVFERVINSRLSLVQLHLDEICSIHSLGPVGLRCRNPTLYRPDRFDSPSASTFIKLHVVAATAKRLVQELGVDPSGYPR